MTYYVMCAFDCNSSIISIIIISRGIQVWIVGIWIKANLSEFILIKIPFWGTFVSSKKGGCSCHVVNTRF